MASMIFAPPLLSVQSFVKLRTNSNYPNSSCYIPSSSKAKSSHVHLSYNSSSHIDSFKSSFTKGDVNFSFPLPKFPRLASTLSPSLNIIKACGKLNIYHFGAIFRSPKEKEGKYIHLGDEYEKKVLLIVNIPDNGSRWARSEIEFLNGLCRKYRDKSSSYGPRGFEVLGFLHDKNDLTDKSDSICEKGEIPMGVEEILSKAEFPIFKKVKVNDNHESHHEFHHESPLHFRQKLTKAIDKITHEAKEKEKSEDLWYFLRTHTPDYVDKHEKSIKLIEQEFEKFLIDGFGEPVKHFIRFDYERVQLPQSVKGGGYTGELSEELRPIDPTYLVEDAIKNYFRD
ncbi:hypothetical protein FXO38_20396 [Capsicum annuum]|uniref:uncharacterized protein LOC107848492 n=1 Tax=Capsicum annuum TaxID=4072 RepID=UPI0007BEB8B8|nr:uncharacterized protein LOC107848492 [Capsicum annuum]KAF3643988.1 hypothetical protein FXO38_20396 [Capsicum annuum]